MTETKRAQLYVDDSAESREAERILDKAGIQVEKHVAGVSFVPGPDFVPPVINTSAGSFSGSKGAQDIVDIG